MMDGSREFPFEQDPADKLDYTVQFPRHCVRYREPDRDYALNTQARPQRATGYQYRASTAGHSGADEPRWPTTIGATVKDGSVIWTTEALAVTSLRRTLSNAVWSPDTGLTASGDTTDGADATAFLNGGTLGQAYLVRCDGTFSDGSKQNAAFWVKITRPRTVSA